MKKLSLLLVLIFVLGSFSAMTAFAEGGEVLLEGDKVWSGDTPYEFSLMIDDSNDLESYVIFDMLEEITNVHVNLIVAPYAVQTEKLAIALSTGDYADAIGGWLLTNKDVIDLSSDGTFLPIEEFVAQYCPNIQQVLDIEGVTESMTLPDGHIYTIPYAVAEPLATFKPYINQVWLDRLGLEMPTTPEELKEVLIAFRDQDANGNGDPNDEIPFSGNSTNNLNLGMCAGWWGVEAVSNNGYPFFMKKDGKLYFSANKPEYKQFIEYFADLYSEGLIDPEIFTHDGDTAKAKGSSDLYGVCICYGPGDFIDGYDEGTEEYEKYGESPFTYLPVLKGCENPVFHRNSYGVTLFRTQFAITDKCDEEKMQVILRYMDVLYEEENSVQAGNGPIGIKIEKIGDHLYRRYNLVVGENGWTEELDDQYSWGKIFIQSMPRYVGEAVVLDWDKEEPTVGFMEWVDTFYEPYLTEMFTQSWGSSEEDSERKSILETDISNYVQTMMAQWICGEADVNEDWDSYCAQLESYGLSELTEIYAREQGIEIHEDN